MVGTFWMLIVLAIYFVFATYKVSKIPQNKRLSFLPL